MEEIKKMKAMEESLRALQLDLEPIRDKALDQKAYFIGYSTCAEQMIKIIVTKMDSISEKIKSLEEDQKTDVKNKLDIPLVLENDNIKQKKYGEEY